MPRLFGALLLRSRTFAEVSADSGAGVQAGIVVVVGGILEAAVSAAVHDDASIDFPHVVYAVLAALIGWLIWSALLYAVGVRVRLFEHAAEFRSSFAPSPSPTRPCSWCPVKGRKPSTPSRRADSRPPPAA